jgi:hypothetical protein
VATDFFALFSFSLFSTQVSSLKSAQPTSATTQFKVQGDRCHWLGVALAALVILSSCRRSLKPHRCSTLHPNGGNLLTHTIKKKQPEIRYVQPIISTHLYPICQPVGCPHSPYQNMSNPCQKPRSTHLNCLPTRIPSTFTPYFPYFNPS